MSQRVTTYSLRNRQRTSGNRIPARSAGGRATDTRSQQQWYSVEIMCVDCGGTLDPLDSLGAH
jgi:hypothetical protein